MKAAGGRVRLTQRGERAVTALAVAGIAVAVLVGFTVDQWSPCAGDHVCVVEVGRG